MSSPRRMSRPCLHVIAGARPNFMKIAPIVRALQADGRLDWRLIHTGQHHDREMNDVFFEELGIPQPHVRLGAGGGSHARQTAAVMTAYEALCQEERPAATLVVGDVNSTLACALAAKKLNIPVAHVEAGLRSGDMSMPEEVNRLATDAICDWFFSSEPSGTRQLLAEGKDPRRVHEAGNVMVDTLFAQAERLACGDTAQYPTDAFKRRHARYGVVTLHRPSNVDERAALERVAGALREISAELPLAFPVHPRTRESLRRHAIDLGPRVELLPPQSYMSFLHLWKDAVVVLTDSGGLQEETTALGVPCVTIRDTTERPVTVELGTNVLAGTDPGNVINAARAAIHGDGRRGQRPPLWDGRAATRIVEVLARDLLPPRHAQRIEVLGCPVDNLSMEETLEAVERMVAAGGAHQHVVVNADKVVKARRDPELRRIIRECDLINADGMPVVWASHLLGRPLKERVAGIDLFEALMARAAARGWRVYLLGAREEVLKRVRAAFEQRHPGIRIVGTRNGYWRPDEEAGVADAIRDARPQLLFVAISSPKKEQFLGRWREHMQVPFAMGVGGSFDVAAGVLTRAPRWMQHTGLEWFHRFLQEPRRMFRRYFVHDMAFFAMLAAGLFARWKKAFAALAATVFAAGSVELTG
jgi:UDP-N-acetylglucosamine 2-epimerase (non-hydrolysing)